MSSTGILIESVSKVQSQNVESLIINLKTNLTNNTRNIGSKLKTNL
jgi:hypothetical protein